MSVLYMWTFLARHFLKLSIVLFTLLVTGASAETTQWEVLPNIADINVVNQDGEKLRFYSDLVKDKTVVINFIYTTCKTVCPTLTAILRQTKEDLGREIDNKTQFISISIDPVNDQPDALKFYASAFEPGDNWAFVTGTKTDIDVLLKSLGAYSPNNLEHQPLILVGNERAKIWTHSYGINTSTDIASLINAAKVMRHSETDGMLGAKNSSSYKLTFVHDEKPAQDADSGGKNFAIGTDVLKNTQVQVNDAAKYFTNLPLVTQDGVSVRFYGDMIQGKVVVLNTMFTHCTMICSPMTQNLANVQTYLDADWAKNVHMISITVDPENDPPNVLKEFANQYHANSQWTFLTGKKENIDWILYKLGAYTELKEEHYSLLIIGNETTGNWMKVYALAKPQEIAAVVKEVATSAKN